MSIVLYALGAGLFAWSALLMIGGESYAAMDIAASLAGWGAFTIGLGALVGAVGRLTRVIADRQPGAAASPALRGEAIRRETETEEIVPVFVPRGEGPAHFEPAHAESVAVEPFFEKAPEPSSVPAPHAEPSPEPAPVRDLEPEPEPDLKSESARDREPEPEPAPLRETEPALDAPPADLLADRADEERADPKLDDLSRSERRALRIKARQARQAAIEKAPVASAEFGVGAQAGRPDVSTESDGSPAIEARPDALRPDAGGGARPIMPRRREFELDRFRPTRQDAFGPTESAVEHYPVAEASHVAAPEVDEREPGAAHEDPPAPQSAPAPIDPPQPDPPASPPEPRIPEWLARARERRAARLQDGGGPATRAVAPPPPEPAPQFRPEPEPPQIDEPAPEAIVDTGPQLLREGEHNGVNYRFYDDGSVEAATAHGVRRFASIAELRTTVLAARGEFAEPEQPGPEPEPESEPETPAPPRRDDDDPLDAALAELEGQPAPEPRIDPEDRPPRLRP